MTKILYVEDNEESRNLLLRRLRLEGNYDVLLANDGLQGVIKAGEVKPDIILMDMSLPVMDGWEASRQIKANPATAYIPIIALTAYAMADEREKIIQAGCDDYHTKPIRIEILLHQIESLLRKSREKEEKQNIAREHFSAVFLDDQIPRSRILVVDDARENCNMLSSRLGLEGYLVETAEHGAKALKMLNQSSFDLVLLDLMMPDLNGFQVLHSIRMKYSLLDLPVIMVTARVSDEDVAKALQEGANDYITKPIVMKTLLARIETHLRIRYISQWKDQFLSLASHDLRNPLSVIYGYIDILIKSFIPGTPMNQELHSYLMKIKKNSEIMRNIISEYLDLKVLKQGQLKVELKEINLLNLFRETVESFKPLIGEKDLSFQIEHEEDIISVYADEDKLIRVVQNLTNNAIKSATAKSIIKFRAEKGEKEILVEIHNRREDPNSQDDGKPTTPDSRFQEMFEINEKGFSPGLIISKLLIEAHGGRIGMMKQKDKTTTIWFRLPVL